METVYLFEVPVLMYEEAPLSIGAESLSEELLAVFLFVFVNDGVFSH
jgi:hypothetical protein